MKILCIYFSFILFLVGNSLHPPTANALNLGFLKGNKWIQTGTGAVNIDNVNIIQHKVKYTVTYPEDKNEDYFKEYHGKITESDIEQHSAWFNPKIVDSKSFYKLQVEAYLMLDLFHLTLFKSEKFIKKPIINPPEEINTKSNGFVMGLDDKDIVNLVEQKDYIAIQKGLKDALGFYNQITNN